MNPKTIKVLQKVLRYGAPTLAVGGLGVTTHGLASTIAASKDAVDKLSNASTDPYWKLRLTGRIPLLSKVITDPEEIADHMMDNIPNPPKSGIARSALRRACLAQAKLVADGRNAAYAGISGGRPVFYGSRKGMNPTVASHETGHYRAAILHGPKKYIEDYGRAAKRFPRPGDVLEKNMWSDGDRMSRPGMEREAWELGPGSQDKVLRDSALNTYKTARRANAEMTYGPLATAAGMLILRAMARR